jgi:hypothetical protein
MNTKALGVCHGKKNFWKFYISITVKHKEKWLRIENNFVAGKISYRMTQKSVNHILVYIS